MSDIRTFWDVKRSRGQWQLGGKSLASGHDLETAVIISLFSDAAAKPDDVIPDGSEDPRGWWGDVDPKYRLGSRLWMLYRAKKLHDTLARAKDYTAEALKWMLDDGVVVRFDITTEWTRRMMLGILVVAFKRDGSSVAMNFSWAWDQIESGDE